MTARAQFAGPDTCAACHAEEFKEWKQSVHANAYSSEVFQKSWKANGAKPECLACHTTGWEKGKTKFKHAGVSCESCHGPMEETHPAAKMPIPVSADMCRTCHKSTHGEWKISAHGQKNIRCFDCHKVHGHGLRLGGGDALCGSCHATKMKDFAHATHHQEGLTCTTCHFPSSPSGPDAIMGTGAPGHNLSVGPQVCARCHDDGVHKSGQLVELRERYSETQKHMAVAGVKNVFELIEKHKDLEWRLDGARSSAWLVTLLGLLAGLGFGWTAAWLALRKRSRK
ncbi:MAG: hypothetical protein IPN90_10620 [Elusimicrobia bacterium]|nr:hypothetical protein [Elusimicrobiota bacterium]